MTGKNATLARFWMSSAHATDAGEKIHVKEALTQFLKWSEQRLEQDDKKSTYNKLFWCMVSKKDGKKTDYEQFMQHTRTIGSHMTALSYRKFFKGDDYYVVDEEITKLKNQLTLFAERLQPYDEEATSEAAEYAWKNGENLSEEEQENEMLHHFFNHSMHELNTALYLLEQIHEQLRQNFRPSIVHQHVHHHDKNAADGHCL